MVLTTLVFFGDPRFRDAIAPVLMIYAATAFGMRLVRKEPAAGRSSGAALTPDTMGVSA